MKTKRLTAKQLKERDVLIEARLQAELQAEEALYKRFDGVTFQAKVLSFDIDRGTGWIRGLGDFADVYMDIHACDIAGRKTWFPETACVFYSEEQIVDVRLDPVTKLIVGVTPGTVDQDKINRLNWDELAFVVKEDGTTTGLFATK